MRALATSCTNASMVVQLRTMPGAVGLVVRSVGSGPAPISACSTAPTVAAVLLRWKRARRTGNACRDVAAAAGVLAPVLAAVSPGFPAGDYHTGTLLALALSASVLARLFAQPDADALLRRQDGSVEDVDLAIGGVTHPDFLLVRRQADAVAGAAVALDVAAFESLDVDAVGDLAGVQVADFEAEEVVDAGEDERAAAVDGEGADVAAEAYLHELRPYAPPAAAGAERRQRPRAVAGAAADA